MLLWTQFPKVFFVFPGCEAFMAESAELSDISWCDSQCHQIRFAVSGLQAKALGTSKV